MSHPRGSRTQVEVLARPYPGKIIQEETGTQAPRRILLTDRQIANQLGFSRDIAQDLVREYLKQKLMHPTTSAEKNAGLGFCAEELAGIIMMAELHAKHQVPMQPAVVGCSMAVKALFNRPGKRVLLCSFAGSCELKLEVIEKGEWLEIPREGRIFITIFDVTILCQAIELAMMETPFKLPKASGCVVNS